MPLHDLSEHPITPVNNLTTSEDRDANCSNDELGVFGT